MPVTAGTATRGPPTVTINGDNPAAVRVDDRHNHRLNQRPIARSYRRASSNIGEPYRIQSA
jgi:hypothetical protein